MAIIDEMTSKTFRGIDGWHQNSINYVRDWYCQWIQAATAIRNHWRVLAADEAWKKIFQDDPRTEERLRKQIIGVRDERLWTILTELLHLIDEVDEEERKSRA
ncbi:MAG: hypothetical protein ACLQPD_06580 [Desulfomonilaceae bacterium]